LITISTQISAKTAGAIGNPHARNAGAYDRDDRSDAAPSASAAKKIHSV